MNTRVTVAIAALVLAACGGEEVASTTAPPTTAAPPPTTAPAPITVPATTAAPSTAAPTTVAPTTVPVTAAPTVPATTAPPVTASPTIAVTTTMAPVASCEPAALIVALNDLFAGSGAPMIADVSIHGCGSGYARVWAIPDMSGCPDPGVPCMESEQVFLMDVAGEWIYIDSGTGITCADTDLLPATRDACDALGF